MGSDKIGDIFWIEGRVKDIEVEVVEVSPDGWACKFKAVIRDPHLGKIGFFLEGEDWVVFDLTIMKHRN